MGTGMHKKKKGPPLCAAPTKHSLRALRAAQSTAELVLCGARCSATLEYFGSKGQCRNTCMKNSFECDGICGQHTCSILGLSDPAIHDFPNLPQSVTMEKLLPTECDDENVVATQHYVAIDPQEYFQAPPQCLCVDCRPTVSR